MGTNRRYSGEISIDPPLTWAQTKKAMSGKHTSPTSYEVKFILDEDVRETETGESIIRTCSAITPYADEPYRGYYVQEALQFIMDACPGSTFHGYFDGVLEDGSEIWRLTVGKDRKVHRLVPKMIWPEV